MTEAQLFEKIGRLQMELEARRAAYTHLLGVFAEVLSGKCDPGRVLINLTDETYCWAEAGTSPGLPAQINGLPVCVVAPPEEELFVSTGTDGSGVRVRGRGLVHEAVPAAV